MNLHAIVSRAIGVVNPPVLCIFQISTGYTIGPDGSQIPTYNTVANVPVQMQSSTYGDLSTSGGLNQQGTRKTAFLNGDWYGLDRQSIKGGDLLLMPNCQQFPGPTTWLVNQVLEHWPGWSKLAITLQNGS